MLMYVRVQMKRVHVLVRGAEDHDRAAARDGGLTKKHKKARCVAQLCSHLIERLVVKQNAGLSNHQMEKPNRLRHHKHLPSG